MVETLHRAWLARRRVGVELAADPGALREAERCEQPVYEIQPSFEFSRERLQFLVWANNYDARGGEPIWWHGRKAARRLGSDGVTQGGEADVTLADGTPLFVDGGPADPPPVASGLGVVHRWSADAGRLDPVGQRPPAAELAPDQLAAVGHRSGAVRVIAPAGSGKTRVLTERLRHVLGERCAHPATVSALAYNAKAAEEMRQRCADLLGPGGPHVRTLNGIGLWICAEFSEGRVRVLEEADVRELCQGVFSIRRQANTDTVAPYIDALSVVRLGLNRPKEVEDAIPDAAGIAEGFDRYRQALHELGAVDFDEQIYRAIEILLADPHARATAQSQCRRLLVDEFQDLTPAHLLLIRLLSAPGYDCFGVGDDDQVIYGYSGATPEYLIDFDRYFPGAVSHPLEVNYRCPPAVVGAARHLLSHNRRRVQKTVRAAPGRTDDVPSIGGPLSGAGPVAVRSGSGAALADLAVEVIGGWTAAGARPSDIAVLARVNAALLPVQVACMESGVPCSTPLGPSVLGRTGIRTTFAYMRIGADPGHIAREDIRDTIRRPSRGISPMVADMVTERPWTSVEDIRRLAGRLSGRDVPKLERYADDLGRVVAATGRSTAAALRAIRTGVGLGDTMDVLDSSRREADRSTHADDLAALESVAALHPDAATFEAWLRGVLGRQPPGDDVVLLSTVHRIKGKEWDHVVVFGASAGLFPHRLSDDEEGERRVFHVALTRARTQVCVLADADAPSGFVAELSSDAPAAAGGPDGDGPEPRWMDRRSAGSSARGGRAPARAAKGAKRTAARALPATPTVAAVVGLVMEHGGHRGAVVEVSDTGVRWEVGEARVQLAFGADVVVDGRTATLVAPSADDGEPGPAAAAAEEALRAWRLATARQESVPAYVVLNDKELTGISARLPSTLSELADCRGMGPLRLERWGDEILALLDDARST